MADVNFNCSECGQNLDAPEDMVGLFIECPSCAKIIKIPRPGEHPGSSAKRSETPFTPPPAVDDDKGKTIPINLPHNLGVPPTPQRRIVIKRKA